MATIKISDYKINKTDQFLFDTNVWLLLFGPMGNYQKTDQKAYSNFLQETIRRDVPVFINSMVISEFTNVLIKIDFKEWAQKNAVTNPKFKQDFIPSQNYKKSVEVVQNILNNIFKIPNLVRATDNFNAISLENALKTLEVIDFNDSYYLELSKINNYKIVTNDRDFEKVSHSIDIITNLKV